MNSNIEIFKNEEFGTVRTIIIDGEPYFVAKDIAYALGYKDPKNTIKSRCKRGRVSEIPHPQNYKREFLCRITLHIKDLLIMDIL